MKKFIEKNRTTLLKGIQAVFILLAVGQAYWHSASGVISNILMIVALEVFIYVAQINKKQSATIYMLVDGIKQYQKKNVEAQDNKVEVIKPGHCDTCPNCDNQDIDCKKLYIQGIGDVCFVKNSTKHEE